jgi:hypothetical protein
MTCWALCRRPTHGAGRRSARCGRASRSTARRRTGEQIPLQSRLLNSIRASVAEGRGGRPPALIRGHLRNGPAMEGHGRTSFVKSLQSPLRSRLLTPLVSGRWYEADSWRSARRTHLAENTRRAPMRTADASDPVGGNVKTQLHGCGCHIGHLLWSATQPRHFGDVVSESGSGAIVTAGLEGAGWSPKFGRAGRRWRASIVPAGDARSRIR